MQSFGSTFGPKSQRKRPTISMADDLGMLLTNAESAGGKYDDKKDKDFHKGDF